MNFSTVYNDMLVAKGLTLFFPSWDANAVTLCILSILALVFLAAEYCVPVDRVVALTPHAGL